MPSPQPRSLAVPRSPAVPRSRPPRRPPRPRPRAARRAGSGMPWWGAGSRSSSSSLARCWARCSRVRGGTEGPIHRPSVMDDLAAFAWRTLKSFKRNQGLLLAGAVAYYALLSIVPMLILFVIALSHVLGESQILDATARYLEWLVPGQGGTLTGELAR